MGCGCGCGACCSRHRRITAKQVFVFCLFLLSNSFQRSGPEMGNFFQKTVGSWSPSLWPASYSEMGETAWGNVTWGTFWFPWDWFFPMFFQGSTGFPSFSICSNPRSKLVRRAHEPTAPRLVFSGQSKYRTLQTLTKAWRFVVSVRLRIEANFSRIACHKIFWLFYLYIRRSIWSISKSIFPCQLPENTWVSMALKPLLNDPRWTSWGRQVFCEAFREGGSRSAVEPLVGPVKSPGRTVAELATEGVFVD